MAENTAAHFALGLWMMFWGVMLSLHPAAASGAGFGCMFMLVYPEPLKDSFLERLFRKVGLLFFSWGLGYGFGVGHAADGGNYAMAVACSIAAVASAAFGALNLMIRNDGPLPQWLKAIVDRIPILKRGD